MRVHRLLGMLILAFLIAGCKAPPGKIKFNDQMAWDIRDLQKAGRDFRKAAEEGASGARTKLTSIEKMLKDMKALHEDIMLPLNSNSAQAYQDAFRAFLDAEVKVAAKMGEVVKQLEANQSAKSLTGLWGEISTIENPAITKLKEAQKAYYDEHHFRGIEKYPQ